jgi:hypothetical protein
LPSREKSEGKLSRCASAMVEADGDISVHRIQQWDLIEAIDCPKGRYLCEVERQIEEKWCCCSEIPALRVPLPLSPLSKPPVTTLRGTPVPRQAPLNCGQQVAPLRLSAAPGRCSEAQLGHHFQGLLLLCIGLLGAVNRYHA